MFRRTRARGVEASGQAGARKMQDEPGERAGVRDDNTLQGGHTGVSRTANAARARYRASEESPGVVTLHLGSVRCANAFTAKWALGLTTKLIHATAG